MTRIRALFAAVLVAGPPAALLLADPADHAAVRAQALAMEAAYARVGDYTTILHKQERVGGTLLPAETIALKFRKPFSVYLKWTGERHTGQEALFVRGWNRDRVRAHPGSFPDVTVDLVPTSRMAMKGNRHPLTEVGFGHTIALVAQDARRSAAHPEDGTAYVDHGDSTVRGALSRCFSQFVPAAAAAKYYAARAEICFDRRTRMPTRVRVWDSDGTLLEDYAYEQTRLDVGLTDLDFDPDNPAYHF